MSSERVVEIGADAAGRLDKVLSGLLPDLSRARLQALIAEGRVSRNGVLVVEGSAKAVAGGYRIEIPAPLSAIPLPEDIPLTVLY